MAKLYRGVPSNTERGRLAKQGIVCPRGDSRDYVRHIRGEDVETDVTSWTRNRDVAKRFGDIILTLDEDDVKDLIVPHPLPTRYPHEQEVLFRGPLENVPQG